MTVLASTAYVAVPCTTGVVTRSTAHRLTPWFDHEASIMFVAMRALCMCSCTSDVGLI